MCSVYHCFGLIWAILGPKQQNRPKILWFRTTYRGSKKPDRNDNDWSYDHLDTQCILHFLYRWDVSNFIVFLVAGCVVTFLLSVVLIEKFTCVPKRLSQVIVQLTANKMLHQMMAITNVLTLLSCVLLPLVSFWTSFQAFFISHHHLQKIGIWGIKYRL